MSAVSNTPCMFALLLSLGFKVVNNVKQNTENVSSLMCLPTFYTIHTKISVYLSGRFTTDYNHYIANIKTSHTRKSTVYHLHQSPTASLASACS